MAKRVAVIDIGSNSVRIVIYERTSRFAFHLLYETKTKVDYLKIYIKTMVIFKINQCKELLMHSKTLLQF